VSMSRYSVEGSALDVPSPDMSITNTVKLVIWDLDDTFWKGTLSEEPVTAIHENIELVKVLAARGIISSICSKNDIYLAAKELHKMAMWDYFVLPSICFQAKGGAIASLIEALHLRPENVVFIDDNLSELAEVAFSCPGIMCLDSVGKLSAQMDSIHLRGSEDGNLPRLAQYQVIAARHESKQSSGASAESFLRQSDIRVEIDYSVEAHIDRVIELINRSNQLNYTKVRVDSEERRAALLASFTRAHA
jgi:FkbH-like protein